MSGLESILLSPGDLAQPFIIVQVRQEKPPGRKEPGGGRLAAFAADLFRNTDNAGYRKPLLKGFQIPRICLEKILLALMDFSSADSSQDRV